MTIYNKNQATVPLVKIIPKIASDCQTKRMTFLSLIQVCSNGGDTYIIDKIIAKNNLNIGYLMQNLWKSSKKSFTESWVTVSQYSLYMCN